ncbi:hypothetical protein PLESTB_000643700 [Pleodorina starrii]|uniref:Uncharacterized protein n=1 Tax=Pleodorina starrii TaxID=330485 RepID=A0A9W6BIR8_9CHLO|nr:hypothetical protein PLESTM_001305000 [Pleodorina starrii]GLC52565.1 hypothetical protein PLESTB_000643700 [Pleodorina starrii]GLC71565.1 hypothetical protein PLESTF_001135900 [Pleodorina starrii]
MPPHGVRPKRGSQSAAARAWDRAAQRIKELGAKFLRSADASLSFAELNTAVLNTAVDDLSVLVHRATKDSSETTPGVWAALTESDGAACLLALYGVVLRCSCSSLTPSIPSSLRPLHASLRAKFSTELTYVVDDVPAHLSKDGMRKLARGLLDTHVLRCYSALISDALRPLMTQLRELQLEGEQHQQAEPQRLSPHRRAMQAVSELLTEARDVVSFLREAYDTCKNLAADPPGDLKDHIGSELTSSGLLEFWCRGALLLAACEGHERTAAVLVESFFCSVHALRTHLTKPGDLLLSSPSLSFLLASHMTQLVTALDGGDALGLPPAAAGWSAPLLAPLLRSAAAAGGGRRQQPRQLDYSGETAGPLYLASMTLWAWTTTLRDEAVGSLTSPLRPDFFQRLRSMSAPSDGPEAGAAGLTAAAARAVALAVEDPQPPPAAQPRPRSLRAACERYLRSISLEICLACSPAGARAMLENQRSASWPALFDVMPVPALQSNIATVCEQTAREVACLRRLAAAGGGPPLNAVGVAETCMRLAAAGRETLLGQSRQPSPAGQAPQQQGERVVLLRLSRAAALQVALEALMCAKFACELLTALAERTELPTRALRLMETCWREWLAWAGLKACATGSGLNRLMAEWDWCEVGRFLAVEHTTSVKTAIPRAPPPAVAAAISMGFHHTLNLVLRRLNVWDRPQCANLLSGILPSLDENINGWQLALAFGAPADVAALLDTLHLLLRNAATDLPTAPPPAAAAGPSRRAASSASPTAEDATVKLETALSLLRCCEGLLFCASGDNGTVRMCIRWLAVGPPTPPATEGAAAAEAAAACASGDAAAAEAGAAQAGGSGAAGSDPAALAGDDGPGAAARQLGSVMSTVAAQLLPASVEMYRRLIPLEGWEPCDKVLMVLRAGPMLLWIPVLCVHATSPAGGAGPPAAAGAAAAPPPLPPAAALVAAEAGAASSAGGGGAADPAAGAVPAGSWADLLLVRIDALRLLRDVVALLKPRNRISWALLQGALEPIQDAVVGLAAFLPRQLAAALKDAPTSGSAQADATAAARVGGAATAAAGQGTRRCSPQAANSAATGGAPLWEGLCWLFGFDGPRPDPDVWALLHRLRCWKEGEESLEDLWKTLPPPSVASVERQQQQEQEVDSAITHALATRIGSIVPPPPHLRPWLSVLEMRGVLDAAKLAAWREAAALLPRGAPDAVFGSNDEHRRPRPAPAPVWAPAPAGGR